MYPAIFLDRDGVIIENREHYVRSLADIEYFPSSLQALNRLGASPYKIIIMTNQSAVGRGIITLETAAQINQSVLSVIRAAGGRVDGLFMCPHAPQDACDCRKPKPGLILKAAKELSLDLHRSIAIGDALTDIKAGQAAGVPVNILVRTGRGGSQLQLPEAASARFLIYDHLQSAVEDILSGLLH